MAAVELDHVVIAVRDLGAAAEWFEARYGLRAVEGGRHPAWGTANRIVPLDDAYLELVTVVDREAAARAAFGRWIAETATAEGVGVLTGWSVRTDAIDHVADRLGIEVEEGSRTGRDGATLRWQLAGVDSAAADPALPFFIQRAPGTPLPGSAEVDHPAGTVGIVGLELVQDERRVRDWLGPNDLPLTISSGPSAVRAVILDTAAGHVRLPSTA